jgi:hypothetical protein
LPAAIAVVALSFLALAGVANTQTLFQVVESAFPSSADFR